MTPIYEQFAILNEAVQATQNMGADGWSYMNPCSSFACKTWNNVTGESLGHRNMIGVSNPKKLAKSINRANNRD